MQMVEEVREILHLGIKVEIECYEVIPGQMPGGLFQGKGKVMNKLYLACRRIQ